MRRRPDVARLQKALIATLSNMKRFDEAIRYGQRGIEIRDAEAAKIPRLMTMTEPRGPPSGDNVISFSLWR